MQPLRDKESAHLPIMHVTMESVSALSTELLEVLETAKSWAFPLSVAFLFGVYPLIILVWTVAEGQAASRSRAELASQGQDAKPKPSKPALMKRVRGMPQRYSSSRLMTFTAGAIVATVICSLVMERSMGFAFGGSGTPRVCDHHSTDANSVATVDVATACLDAVSPTVDASVSIRSVAGIGGSILLGFVALSSLRRQQSAAVLARGLRKINSGSRLKRNGSSGVLRHCASYESLNAAPPRPENVPDFPAGVSWYDPPPAEGASMWHTVELHVRDWLDEPTGEYRYVNEIPRGALQKFEMQTRLKQNVIREDSKGSKKLQAFGEPVPFNYGCFPKTYRDPQQRDDIHNAPGDDDPLDVIDLTPEPVGVGVLRRCRVLGAVCLIDEGQADYKVFVVNTEAQHPLAAATCIEDVEKLEPGRVEACLRWMDDFKEFSSQKATTLHYEILDATKAEAIVEKDYASWQRLVKEADATGVARGHWIRPSAKQSQVVDLRLRDEHPLASHMSSVPSSLLGVSSAPLCAPAVPVGFSTGLTMRRQATSSSDAESSASSLTSLTSSNDAEIGI